MYIEKIFDDFFKKINIYVYIQNIKILVAYVNN